jgi:hypothetical protein
MQTMTVSVMYVIRHRAVADAANQPVSSSAQNLTQILTEFPITLTTVLRLTILTRRIGMAMESAMPVITVRQYITLTRRTQITTESVMPVTTVRPNATACRSMQTTTVSEMSVTRLQAAAAVASRPVSSSAEVRQK